MSDHALRIVGVPGSPYSQGKCLRWLREGHAALGPDDGRAVDALLRGTGCERLFAERMGS